MKPDNTVLQKYGEIAGKIKSDPRWRRFEYNDDCLDEIANRFGGKSISTGGGITVALIPLADHYMMGVSDEVICLYFHPDFTDSEDIFWASDSTLHEYTKELTAHVVATPTVSERLKEAVTEAGDEFWATIAKRFPEAKSGDLDPTVVSSLRAIMNMAARWWVETNVEAEPAQEDVDEMFEYLLELYGDREVAYGMSRSIFDQGLHGEDALRDSLKVDANLGEKHINDIIRIWSNAV